MNPILNDPLVKKYFECGHTDDSQVRKSHVCDAEMALRVLDAMTAPIKAGEKLLSLAQDGHAELFTERPARLGNILASGGIHPWDLRLPDAHQEPDYEKELEKARGAVPWCALTTGHIVAIHDLIDLARKAERQRIEKERR